MISSVGVGVVQACASLRAELTRPRPLVYFSVLEEDSQELVPLTAHPIQGFTEGFAPVGRWLRLAQGCMDDLLAQGVVPERTAREFWQRTALLWVGPVLDEGRFLEPRQMGVEVFKQAFLQQLEKVLELPLARSEARAFNLGHAGLAAALRHAQERSSRCSFVERFLILAMDSYVDELSLEWLQLHRRLKTPEAPVGLMPGEAGACVLVELSSRARSRGASVQALVNAASLGQEANHFFSRAQSNTPNVGRELSRIIEVALSAVLPPDAPFQGDVISDLNGEVWRASEWGHTVARLHTRLGTGVRLVTPCASLGDTGAASGAVALCVAVRSFHRKYASGPRSLVVSSAEHGATGAIVVGARG
ncbi:MAG TPA: hypothetical protein VEU50_35865 [Archangium sp.]|nr:hypothetical protein [Archangium sp.]